MRSALIPNILRDSLERLARPIRPAELAASAERLSLAYRSAKPAPIVRRPDLAAYAITRLPATYAALACVFSELPDAPATMVDFGAGPGVSVWAGREIFGPELRATLIEQNTNWPALAAELGLAGEGVTWRLADVRRLMAPPEAHDLAVASYVLNELSSEARTRLVRMAWAAAGRWLVLVEPGTPAGFQHILAARQTLVELGAQLLAPCPHGLPCPLQAPDWCHFAVRVERTRAHRAAKGGALGYEDEKFAYVIASREPVPADSARVLRHPLHAPGHIELKLCTPSGIETRGVRKRDAEWKGARKVAWGERWPKLVAEAGD